MNIDLVTSEFSGVHADHRTTDPQVLRNAFPFTTMHLNLGGI